MAENKNCVKTSVGSLQFYISTKSVKDVMGCMEKSMYSLRQTGLLWICLTENENISTSFSVKSQMSVFMTTFSSGQDGDDTNSSQMDRHM